MSGRRKPQSPKKSPSKPELSNEQESLYVVGIGASAGGLDACRKLLAAMPSDTGMAFILIQHLDPSHESMMVDLLAGSTSMAVKQATHGENIEKNHLYVIPPGFYLSVVNDTLRLSQPEARHGARMPFDYLLKSLAENYGPWAICIILSGTGTDGSIGLKAVSDRGGVVIAEDPDEAAYDGMPRNAISTGLVRYVLPLNAIPSVLLGHDWENDPSLGGTSRQSVESDAVGVSGIIHLLRDRTSHNFSLYKTGTLLRRIQRRMGLAGCEGDFVRYQTLLKADSNEVDALVKDLLIHVTSFFRDPDIFEFLAENIISDLITSAAPGEPLRIWIAGCSTGEEAYSLAILFREKISELNSNVKYKIFASDIDVDAIAHAREGLYPATAVSAVPAARLARFFKEEEEGFRVAPDLREAILFTAQDLLADPPFSRLDLISCRNLLIYLKPEAQAQIISQFHFALRLGGYLFLGSSETIGTDDGRFDVVSKPNRIYRHIGRHRPGEFGLAFNSGERANPHTGLATATQPARQDSLADLCKRIVVAKYAPAVILTNRAHECLFTLGPINKYLQVATGHPTHDVLAMVRRDLRTKLRAALQLSQQKNESVTVSAVGNSGDRGAEHLDITVEPILHEREDLLLISFVTRRGAHMPPDSPIPPEEMSRVQELERELAATRIELEGAVLNLENSSQEQKAINQEALSVNEEYQSTNEELVTSKEELQSLNEELTALNSQLHETLERQRRATDDLQNILYSTDVATIFLDTDLNIRFFTPAAKSLLNLISGDIGRPIADLSAVASDTHFAADARTVMKTHEVSEREIRFPNETWYNRQILPYRTEGNGVEGIVVTFNDITDRKNIAATLNSAATRADHANRAKTRFLAAASHDLRQPLQTLTLLQGILARTVKDEQAQKLITRIDETLGTMSEMLNALLDINEIEAGTVHVEKLNFPINHLIDRMRDEFDYHAQAKGLTLRTVPCGLTVCTDPRLLEQMVRNLLSNALKYTGAGKILLGCRRQADTLRIEVLDTGIGVPENQYAAIFEEYYQIGNEARDRSMGLGLGLAIVQRLGGLLGHRLAVRSLPDRGSVFSIDVPLASKGAEPDDIAHASASAVPSKTVQGAMILIAEDDAELRDVLELLFKGEGYRTIVAEDAQAALMLSADPADKPDLILADYNLPNGMNGLELVAAVRDAHHSPIPAILLTGDISTETLQEVGRRDCFLMSKPVKAGVLSERVVRLLTPTIVEDPDTTSIPSTATSGSTRIFVVDDDPHVSGAIRTALEMEGHVLECYANCEDFLKAYRPGPDTCLLIDSRLPGMQGIELLEKLRADGSSLPAIMITGNGDVATAVRAMKAGALDFIEKPFDRDGLVESIDRALARSRDKATLTAWRQDASGRLADLTTRQRQVLDMVLAGHPSKNIAADLGISQRTVENHRAAVMKRMGARSLPELVRLASAADGDKA